VIEQQRKLDIRVLTIGLLKPYARNPRTHSDKQINQIANSIRQFGFTNPVLIDSELGVIAGHGRIEAAKLLGIGEVPTIRLDHMTEAQKRAYVVADNRLAENAGWDRDPLALELQYSSDLDLDFDATITGFETPRSTRAGAELSVPSMPTTQWRWRKMRIREPREMVLGVSFRDFAALARKKLWTGEYLAREFKGAIEGEPASSFFGRVLGGDPSPDVVIPYLRIIRAYLTAVSELIADRRLRVCACGCGSPVFGKNQTAREGCAKVARKRPSEGDSALPATLLCGSPKSLEIVQRTQGLFGAKNRDVLRSW